MTEEEFFEIYKRFFLLEPFEVDEWFRGALKCLKDAELSHITHKHSFDLIKLLLTDKNEKVKTYGKIMSYVLYKEDQFQIKGSSEYKEIMREISRENGASIEEETPEKTSIPTRMIKLKAVFEAIYIQQVCKILTDSSKTLFQKRMVWGQLDYIIKISSVSGIRRNFMKIIEFYEKHRELALLPTNCAENPHSDKNISPDKNPVDGVTDLVLVSNDVMKAEDVPLGMILLVLVKRKCNDCIIQVLDYIFEPTESITRAIFRFRLMNAIHFMFLNIKGHISSLELMDAFLSKLPDAEKSNFDITSVRKLKSIYDILLE